MQVFDEITNKLRNADRCARIIVKHIPGCLVYGYSSDSDSIITFLAFNGMRYDLFRGDKNLLKDVLVFSTKRGCYVSTVDFPKGALLKEVYTKGSGEFPYNFAKRYEAIESFNIFNGRQQVVDPKNYNIAKYLKYSFGLEFETSMGYVPEDLCFRDGLIPLRDGSITGLEYSTVVLEGNTGLCLLNQQIKTLKRYTAFNKECSLHMHFGGFPLTPEYLYRVYKLCKGLEDQIRELVPPLTFNSAEYKDNGKDYCKCLKPYRSFNHMYENLVGRQFFGSLTQPHPNDVKREAKWRIPTRYYWVNFINAICYKVNKTIEFRLLRPTYNFEKISIWLCIFSAILQFAERYQDPESYRNLSLANVIEVIYPPEIASYVIEGITKLSILTINQANNGDNIGNDIEFENSLFKCD